MYNEKQCREHPRLIGVKVLLVMSLFGCGASTRYAPQRSDHLYLVLQDGVLSYRKNTTVVGVYSPEAEALFACNERARTAAHDSGERARNAVALGTMGYIFGLIGAVIVTPIAQAQVRRATAESVDALNMHNDDDRCVPELRAMRTPVVVTTSSTGQPEP